jgi:hypothetical protein
LEVANMNKAHKALGLALVVLSVAVSGLCFAAWRPVVPPAVEAPQAPAAPKAAPVVLETGSLLVLAPRAKEAPKARPVAARARAWGCGERIVMDVGPKARAAEPSSVRSCGWR